MLFLASAIVGGAPGDERIFVDMNHITSNDLDDLARLGLILQMEFTYLLYEFNIPKFWICYLPSVTYTTVGPKKCPRTGSPTLNSTIQVIK
jgi:hypothetical protein